MKVGILSILCFLLPAIDAFGMERQTRIPIDVEPFYVSSPSPDEAPKIRVGSRFDQLLASTDPRDILKVRDLVLEEPERATPLSMMVLAIRLYDTGARDEAVFWFYVAKNRYWLLSQVIDVRASGITEVSHAMHWFQSLAGPFINSYAFCDIEKKITTRARALEWTKQHPYTEVLMWKDLVGRDGDRLENMTRTIQDLEEGANSEAEQLQDQDFIAKILAKRAENNADAEFCWTS